MNYLDKYKHLIQFDKNKTDKDILIDEERENFNTYVNGVPNSYTIKKWDNIGFSIKGTLQDVGFNDKKRGDEKLLCTYYDADLNTGNIVILNNNIYTIIYEEKNTIKSHKSFIIRPCNNSLKYYLPSNSQQLYDIPCIETNLSMYSMGVDEGRIITTENGKRAITITYNKYTKELKSGMRFILNGDTYSITEIYKGKVINGQGILEIKLQSCAKSDKDNFEKGIAYNDYTLNEYKITILNGQKISLNNNETLQLNVEVLNNNIKINNSTISYTSNNENIATVDENGLITAFIEGISIITATYKGISTSIEIDVMFEPVETHNYTVTIEGGDQAYLSWNNNYSCEFRDNGIAIDGIKAIWNVFAEDGISSTNLATIKSQTSNSCILRGNDDYKFGSVILQCQSENGKIKNTKKIEIISAL